MPDFRILLPALSLALVACSTTTERNPATLSPAHPFPVADTEADAPAEWAQAQLAWQWDYPAPLIHDHDDDRQAHNCLELLTLTANGYQARNPFERPFLQARTTLCQAVRASGELSGFEQSFLGDSMLPADLPYRAPAEMALAISGDAQQRVRQSDTWAEVEAPANHEPVSNYEAVYRGQHGAIQRLTVLARGDYNGDGVEDAIVYMMNGVDGGSYAHARYLVVTRLAEGAPLALVPSQGQQQ